MLLAVLLACSTAHRTVPMPSPAAPPPRIEFLTRTGCANTPVLQERLAAALDGRDVALTVVSLEHLSDDDVRTGYGTPTILVDGADLFGQPQPEPPYAAPS